MGRISYIVFIVWSVCACKYSQTSHSTLPIINIDSSYKETIPFTTLFDSIKYVTLKETGQTVFGYITKLVTSQEYLIFSDGQSNSIFIYDFYGNCRSCIHRPGRGEEEYIRITDIAFDKVKGQIAVLDTFGKKILYYDLDGQYLCSQTLPDNIMPNSLYLTDDKICLVCGSQWKVSASNCNFLNVLTRDSLHFLYSAYPVLPIYQSLSFYGEFRNTLCSFGDTLYSISTTDCLLSSIIDSLQPAYVLSFADKRPIEKLKKLNKNELDRDFWKKRYVYSLSDLLVGNRFIYFVCNEQNNVLYIRHNRYTYSWKNIAYNNSLTSCTFIAQTDDGWLICNLGETAFGLNSADIAQTEDQRTLLFLRLRKDL